MQNFITDGSTIISCATGTGGAINLLRLSGPKALEICQKFCVLLNGEPLNPTPRKAVLAKILDKGEILDTALFLYFKAPGSYTGEDVAEINCHASSYISSRIIALALEHGARTANPGEYSMRAFLNGKIDLVQAEGICDLITASTKSAHRAAINLTQGKTSQAFYNIKNTVTDMLAEIEARLDDSDEEIKPINTQALTDNLQKVAGEVRALAATFELGKLIKEGVKTAIAGLPNSGKSSLLNALSGYDRAIVSPVAGTTRDTIEQFIDIDGLKIVLTDTAGLHNEAQCEAEKEGILRTKRAVETADLVLFVADASKPDFAQDIALFNEISALCGRTIVVENKIDLGHNSFAVNNAAAVAVSCKTGEGIDSLKQAVKQAAGLNLGSENACIITSARHHEALLNIMHETEVLTVLLGEEEPALELAAVHLREILNGIAFVVGETTADDVLGAVFSKFCVGK